MEYIGYFIFSLPTYVTEPLAIPFEIAFLISLILLILAIRKSRWWKWTLQSLIAVLGFAVSLYFLFGDSGWYPNNSWTLLSVGYCSMVLFGALLLADFVALMKRLSRIEPAPPPEVQHQA